MPCEEADRRGITVGFARGLRGRWQGAPVGSTGIALAPDRAPEYCKLYHDPAQHFEEMACGAVIHLEKTEGICVSECLRGCSGGLVRAGERPVASMSAYCSSRRVVQDGVVVIPDEGRSVLTLMWCVVGFGSVELESWTKVRFDLLLDFTLWSRAGGLLPRCVDVLDQFGCQ